MIVAQTNKKQNIDIDVYYTATGHKDTVNSVDFSTDGSRFASGQIIFSIGQKMNGKAS
jgi:hypothetical protein